MAVDINALTDELGAGFIPDSGQGLAAMLESLPAFFEALKNGLVNLSEFIGDGPAGLLEDAGGRVNDMAVHAGAAEEAAREAYLEARDKISFWLDS
jgi:hypothetical protein